MKDKLTPKVVGALTAVAVVAVALIGWFGLVSPQRSDASSLDRQIQEAKTQLIVAKSQAKPAQRAKAAASERTLARAMPRRVAMAGVLRQLVRVSKRTGVQLDGVTPQAATSLTSYEAVPMDVKVSGRYLPIQRFLHRLRVQAGVAGDHVHAKGRLFSVESINLAADEELPRLTATIHMNAFVYGKDASSPAPVTTTDAPTSSATAAGGMSK
jgi:Tfp pilus assembly protein PilO